MSIVIGNVASSVGGALAVHFFGKKLDQKLTIEKFQEFHTLLNTEILLMEVCKCTCTCTCTCTTFYLSIVCPCSIHVMILLMVSSVKEISHT